MKKTMSILISGIMMVSAMPLTTYGAEDQTIVVSETDSAPDSGKSVKDKLKDFIDDNKLDASVYIFPSGYGYLTSIAYYESDTETLDKIKAFMKAEGISESAIRFKAYKGEKPNGGMIKDYAVILPKIVKCIEDNKLNAQIMLWDSRYTTEIDYSLYLDGESPDGFNIPDGYVFKTETIFNIVVKCLEKNQIIIDIMDAMFANENIDPSTVQYFLLLNGAGDQPSDDNTAEIKKNITLEEVDNLSKKGYELTLKDLEGYNYIDTGNGILSGINREYFIDEEYSLVVIQEENESKPRSIVLCSNRGFAVDIRSSEYQDFFEKPILYLITEPADTDHNEYNVILANGSLYGGPMEKGFFYNLVDSSYFTEDTPKAVRGIAKKDLKVNDDLLDLITAVCKEVAENSEQTELVECTGYKITSERERLFIVNDGKAYAIADFGETFRIINNKNAQALIEKLIDTGYSETVSKIQGSTISGDANGDGQVSMADAVTIMQYISNPDKYGENGTDKNHITEQGKKNADIAGENDGVTNADALAIQKKLLKLD